MIDFHYKTFGNDRNPPLLILHGFMGSSKDFTEIAESLSENNYIILIDLPGHGKTITSDESDYKSENCAEQIIKLLNNLSIKKTDLLGYSMGGRMALYLTVKFPDRFDKIIIESSSPGLETSGERSERIKNDAKLSERINQKDLPEFIDIWYSLPLFKTIDKNSDNYKKMHKRRLENRKEGLILSLKHFGTGSQPSLWNFLSDINQKLLLIVGEEDDKFVNIANNMHKKLKNSVLKIVKDTGHNVHLERPEKYIKLVKEFIK